MSQRYKRDIKAAKSNDLQRIEHSEVFDDNLLPDASEVEKLMRIDPTILTWLKGRAEVEQDFRHKSYGTRMKLLDDHNCREHNTTRFSVTVYFILVSACIVGAFLLLREGHNLQGSLFGGAAAILALAVLIARGRTKTQPSEKEPK